MRDDSSQPSRAAEVRQTSVGWMIKILGSILDAEIKAELDRLDLTFAEFGVMMTLLDVEGLTQVEIGRRIMMKGYATTRTLDALEDKRLAERRPDERSRRSHRVYLTDTGRKLGPELFVAVQRVNAGLMELLDDDERDAFQRTLRKLVAQKIHGDEP